MPVSYNCIRHALYSVAVHACAHTVSYMCVRNEDITTLGLLRTAKAVHAICEGREAANLSARRSVVRGSAKNWQRVSLSGIGCHSMAIDSSETMRQMRQALQMRQMRQMRYLAEEEGVVPQPAPPHRRAGTATRVCNVQCAMCNVRVQASVQCAWVRGRGNKAALELTAKKVMLLTASINWSTFWLKRMVWAITTSNLSSTLN